MYLKSFLLLNICKISYTLSHFPPSHKSALHIFLNIHISSNKKYSKYYLLDFDKLYSEFLIKDK